jgi:adenylosuccinate synthase
MKIDVLLGLQWGDEGKGKVVDYLAPRYDVIARFQGGPNAGHTLEFDGRKQVLHTIPSGIFHEKITNVIGNGVIIDPLVLMKEITQLRAHGADPLQNLLISKKAHLILPSHLLLDALYEQARAESKIGSTLKGIGPAYTDKTSRNGLRVGDIKTAGFERKYRDALKRHLSMAAIFSENPKETILHGLSFEEYELRWLDALNSFREIRTDDTEYFINDCLKAGKKVLAEGAQGTLLDVEFGSYPFVTSSNTTTAGVCSGLGVSPRLVGNVFGVFKAYCTRVGSGPFPTELKDDTGELLRKLGNEFGSTTGRARRCGWLDLPALQYAIMLNGVTHLLMMKSDVMNTFPVIKVCDGYHTDAGITKRLKWDATNCKPNYREMEGWQQGLENCNSLSDLPENLTTYIRYIEETCDVPVTLVSTGPDRSQTIIQAV